jgi:hypothetical protein
MLDFSPVVLFVHSRPWHTRQTVQALQENTLAEQSDLFVFSDAARNDEEVERVEEVRRFCETIDCFKKVTVVERQENCGLANSVIRGVTDITDQYGSVIVLEDDIVTGPFFLKYMNDALRFYEPEPAVWHISGWNYPIKSNGLGDAFLWRGMECWGWGTWSDRWKYFEKDTSKLMRDFSKEEIHLLNLDGCHNSWSQVIANAEQEIDTWAIYWYATLFKHRGLCLSPTRTHVRNIGFDGSGVHRDSGDIYGSHRLPLSQKSEFSFPTQIRENEVAVDRIKLCLRSAGRNAAVRLLKKLLIRLGIR